MTYTEVFGGGTINPAQRTYLSLVTAVDVTLQWPINTVGGDNVAADIIDVNATAPGVDINLSDARQVSNGFTSLFVNVGAQDFQVLDALGATIVSPAIGTAWFIYLTDNSTEDGTWATFQLGATVSVADAAALAGAGLQQILTTLNQSIPPVLTGVTPITWTDANRALMTIWTGGVGVLNLPTVASVGSDWFAIVRNEGSGTLTLTPVAGTIDSASTLVMNPGDSAIVVTDGLNWYTVGLGGTTTVGFDYVQIDVSGSGDFILSGVQLDRISYQFIGTLTGNRKIVVPNTIQQYWVDNSTAGAFTLEVATAAQVTPIPVLQNNRAILYCNGTDVIDAETGTFTPPVLIGQGGTSAVTAAGAMANLGIARTVDTAANSGLGGGGNLGADLALVLDVDNLPVQLTVDPVADVIAFYDDDAMSMAKTPIANITGSTLVDSGGNIRISAETGGIAQLRSDGNTDTERRVLRLTHQDGTARGNIGFELNNDDLVIENLALGEVIISATPIRPIFIGNRFRVLQDGDCQVVGGPSGNPTLRWTDSGLSTLGQIRYPNTDVFEFENTITNPGVAFRFVGEDVATIRRTMLEMNPNDGPHLFESGVEVARVAPAASGGFEVNNTLTGGGFERVLTSSDFGGTVVQKHKTTTTIRAATGVLADPELNSFILAPGYWSIEGVITFGATPGNGGIDLNWLLNSGTLGTENCSFMAQNDVGTSPSGIFWGVFDISNITDLTLTYAVRNDTTRGFIQGAVEVLTTADIDFAWAPRLAANQGINESSWIRFTKLD